MCTIKNGVMHFVYQKEITVYGMESVHEMHAWVFLLDLIAFCIDG